MPKDKLNIIIEKLDKITSLLEELKPQKQTKKKYLVEDYNSPLEPVPWWVHSPQYNKGFTCCADTSSELIIKPGEETPHELKIK